MKSEGVIKSQQNLAGADTHTDFFKRSAKINCTEFLWKKLSVIIV